MLETLKLSKTLKSCRDDFNFSSIKTAISPNQKNVRSLFSGKFLSKPHLPHISFDKKSIVVTGVNLVTEVEQP